MSHNQVRLLLSDVDGHSEWFRFRNINKWIHKFWKPGIIGIYVGKYEGEWKDGQMHGKGTLRISRIFRGYLSLGLVAFGWKLIDQGKYVGEWKKGKENGKGIRYYRAGLMNVDNGKYEGEWKNGLFHGKGIRIFPGGEKYEGEWKNGKEHGHGISTWFDGRKFVRKFIGEWKNGQYLHGTYNLGNGDKHFGFFKDGLAEGHGTRTYSDGGKYSGEFKCTQYHGQGTYYSSCGEKLVGRFKEGIPWNTTDFDKDQNLIGLHVKGVERNITPLKPTPSPL